MPYISLNPATNKILKTYTSWDTHRLAESLEKSRLTQEVWRQSSFEQRATLMHRAANLLLEKRDELALLITQEMGKPIKESRSEVEKCAAGCEYYAIHAAHFLQNEPIESDAGESYVSYLPLGTVLAIMPWNFPLWQVFRFAAPALMAGNAGVLKHASNVPQCALAIENIFRESGFPDGLFTTLMIDVDLVNDVIASRSVHAVTLTGSEPAGRKVAAAAGLHLKKCVLELGGSDAFVVLHDADIEYASQVAATSRFLNCGQSCIAAKRFILVPEIAEEFVALFKQKVSALNIGDPMEESTQVGPMARLDLRDEIHRQITDSIAQGAEAVIGCKPLEGEGAFYAPSILDHVTAKTRAYHEELFGPAAIIIRAQDEMDALHIANDTKFGLGSSLWSKDTARAEKLSRELHAGCTFINGMVKSDPRLPFGGIKASGFGRELSYHGIREFVNTKTVWIK